MACSWSVAGLAPKTGRTATTGVMRKHITHITISANSDEAVQFYLLFAMDCKICISDESAQTKPWGIPKQRSDVVEVTVVVLIPNRSSGVAKPSHSRCCFSFMLSGFAGAELCRRWTSATRL